MKTNNLFKVCSFLLAIVGGMNTAWATGNISIPQNLGSYILIGTSTGGITTSDGVTITNCKVDAELGDKENNEYYSVGSTGNSSTVTFALTVSDAANYVFGFKTGADGCTATLSLKLNNGSSDVWTETASVENTGSWTPTTSHVYTLGNLAAGSYTMTISVSANTGSYAGNWGNFFFHTSSQLAMPTSSEKYLEFSDGEFSNARDNSDNVVNYIYNGGYIDNLLIYNNTEGYYSFNFNIDGFQNYDDSQVSITVSNFNTGVQEYSQTINVTKNGNYVLPFAEKLTAGLKKVRIGFASTKAGEKHLFNFRQVYFPSFSYDALPLSSTATLNLNQTTATFTNCSYESGDGKNNIGNIKGTSPSADNYYVLNTNESAYYDLYANISWHKSESTLKVTVTDLATGNEEATGTSSSITATGNIHFALNNPITAGSKRIRFDFVSATTSDYLYNVKDISFYKRSLNEAYDYTAVAASDVDVVLTRSITADKWSTICLPFAMTSEQITTAFGAGVQVAELTSGDASTLTFSTVTAMEANKPYAIKVTSAFSSATIENVTIAEATPTQSISNWNFVGNYSTGTSIPVGSYFFGNNRLYQASASTKNMKPFRAYFTYTGGGSSAPELNFVIDDMETTGVNDVNRKMSDVKNEFYNLNGQRVNKPMKGLYIVNGKKVVIK